MSVSSVEKIRAGKLRHTVRVQRASEVRGTSGMVTFTWTDLEPLWRASIEPMTLRGQERLVGNQKLQEITHVVTIRYLRGLLAKDRIVWNDRGVVRTLEIASIADILENHWMQELLCKEVA
jgi:SPP1 family predicted phage head-tail adaptor